MNIRKRINRVLAAILVLCLGLTPVLAAGAHVHTWTADWASDSICHWHGCADPDCRTLVPAWAGGYAYHVYDSVNDPDCSVCGHIRAVDPGHTHTWGDGWSGDGAHHWRPCTDPDCPGVAPAQARDCALHVYSGPRDPDCDVCGWVRFLDPNHSHTWGDQWNGDENYHWYQCADADCPGVVPGQAKGYALHSYDGPRDPDCNLCGWVRSAAPDHTHVWGTQWEGNESCHWYQCTAAGCPGVVPAQAKGSAPHVYDGVEDTDCNICGRTRAAFPLTSGLLSAPPAPDADVTIVGKGRVYASPANPGVGDKVFVILTPDEHYAAGSLTVTAYSGEEVEAADQGDGTWSFRYPGEKVRLRAVFPHAYQACAHDGGCPLAAYGDLSPAGWYHDGIHYCLDRGLMRGCDPVSFDPGGGLSGGMMAQMLYNLAGQPDLPGKSFYTGTGAWYDAAVTWAVGAGVLNVEEGFWKFSPDEDITREQLVMLLWRYAGRPTVSGRALSFPDAGALSYWAVAAARWAADSGILTGRENGRLDPGGKVTRGEAAAMLVRFLESTQT